MSQEPTENSDSLRCYAVGQKVRVTKNQSCWNTGGYFAVVGDMVEISKIEGDSLTVKKQNGGRFTIWKRDVEASND